MGFKFPIDGRGGSRLSESKSCRGVEVNGIWSGPSSLAAPMADLVLGELNMHTLHLPRTLWSSLLRRELVDRLAAMQLQAGETGQGRW